MLEINQRVTLSVDDNGIAEVVLNRADKLNALDMAMFKALTSVIKQIKRDKRIRIVILSAAGSDFCSGLDVKSVMGSPISAFKLLFKWLPSSANLAQKVTANWRKLPVPVIVAIDGKCWGGGMQIALGADFRIAAKNASLSIMEAKWGLIPDMAGNSTLAKLIPIDHALKLVMTAQTFTGEQALEYKLVTELADNPLKAAHGLAQQLLQTSPDVLAAYKMLMYKNWQGSERRMLRDETWFQMKILSGNNQKIATSKARGQDVDFKSRRFK